MSEASIVLKLLDQLSPGLSAVRRATDQSGKSFDDLAAKVTALRQKNDALNKNYSELQTRLLDARRAVQEATKAYKDNADEVNRTNLQQAQEQYKTLTDQLNDFRSASADTRKEIRELQTEMRKMDTGGGGSTGWGGALRSVASQLGSAVTGLGSSVLTSVMGSTDASMITGTLSGALSGAAMGAAAGPAGAAIGALVGGAAGLIESWTGQMEAEDEVFRGYRDDLIQSTAESMQNTLTSGAATAAQREQDRIAFATLLGDGATADSLLGSIKELANVTPYVYDDLTGIARALATFDSTSGDLYGNLVKIGDTASALALSTSDAAGLAQLLGRIGESETFSSIYKRSLMSYLINPADAFSYYFDISKDEATKLMNSGKLSGSDAMDALFAYFEHQFGGMMEEQSQSYAGALSTRQGLTSELQNYMGEGYTTARALKEHNDWLEQFIGSEAYERIGEAYALKENREDALYRDIWGGVFNGDASTVADLATRLQIAGLRAQYLSASSEFENAESEKDRQDAGAKIASIKEQTEALAAAASDADSYFDSWDEAAIATSEGVASIVATLDAYKDQWAYGKVQERGKLATIWGIDNDDIKIGPAVGFAFGGFSSAVGKRTVPYDGFPILAHEGEVLLTAEEARQYRGGGPAVTVTGNTFIVREDADIDAIADALYQKFRQAARILE